MTEKILVCHDVRIVQVALEDAIARDDRFAGVELASTLSEATVRLAGRPDPVVLLAGDSANWGAPLGVATIRKGTPDARIVVLDVTGPVELALRNLGAWGCLPSTASVEMVLDAAATAAAGRRLGSYAIDRSNTDVALTQVVLSEREQQVLTLLADGRSNLQIGRTLYISEDTVKTHARRLFRKLGARDRAHAVATGMRNGFVA